MPDLTIILIGIYTKMKKVTMIVAGATVFALCGGAMAEGGWHKVGEASSSLTATDEFALAWTDLAPDLSSGSAGTSVAVAKIKNTSLSPGMAYLDTGATSGGGSVYASIKFKHEDGTTEQGMIFGPKDKTGWALDGTKMYKTMAGGSEEVLTINNANKVFPKPGVYKATVDYGQWKN